MVSKEASQTDNQESAEPDLINRYTARVAGIILVFGTPNHFSAFVYVLSVRIKFMANEKRLQKECRAYRRAVYRNIACLLFLDDDPVSYNRDCVDRLG